MSKLYVLCGIPGSGKSTIAKKLNVILVSTDATRGRLWGDESKQFDDAWLSKFTDISDMTDRQKENLSHTVVFTMVQEIVRTHLENGNDVVVDAVNGNSFARKMWTKLDADEKIAIVMTTPFEECVRRNNSRESSSYDRNGTL